MPKPPRLDTAASFLLFLLAVLALLGLNLDFALWEPWEPKNARSMVEMLERGDLLTPYFRGDPRFSKPGLIYWLMAPAYALFGPNEVALRLPTVLLNVAGVAFMIYALRILFSARVAFLAAAVLVTSPQYFFLARQVTPDAILSTWIGVSLLMSALALLREERRTQHMLVAYLAAAVAVWAKGPLALFILAGVLGAYLVGVVALEPSRLRAPMATAKSFFIDRLKLHWGLALLLILTLPWYIYNALEYDIFLERLRFDYLDRAAVPEGNHDGSLFYYVETLAYGMFPWSCMIPAAIIAFGASMKERSGPGVKPLLLVAAWFLVPFTLFTVSATKFTYYIAPALPPLAIFLALLLDRYLSGHIRHRWIAGLGLISLAILVVLARELAADAANLVGTFTIKTSVTPALEADPNVSDPRNPILASALLFGAMLFSAALLTQRQWRGPLVFTSIAVALAAAAYHAQVLVPSLSPHKSQKLTTAVVLSHPENEEVVCISFPGRGVRQHLEWTAIEGSTFFYGAGKVVEIGTVEELAQYFIDDPGRSCIVRSTYLGALRARLRAQAHLGLETLDRSHYRFHVVRAIPLP